MHRRPVLFRVAGWAGAKFCKKIVHWSLTLGMRKPACSSYPVLVPQPKYAALSSIDSGNRAFIPPGKGA
jgi:hypothetical protein